jgi:acetyl esterase/lipase
MTHLEMPAAALQRQMQLFARLHAETPAPRPRHDHPGVTSYYDLTYAVVPGFRPLVLDLHTPEAGSAFPVLLWAHGGGWSGGNRAMGQAIKLVPHGYAVAAVQYRLSGEARYPAQLYDLKGAVRWLRATAPQYQLDAEHIVGWGASAGAHLVSLVALTAGRPELEGDVGGNLDQPSSLQAVIDYFGPSDFFAMGGNPELPGGNPVTALLGYAIEERPEAAREAVPVTHVRPDAPPFLILHGDADPIIPYTQSERLHNALTQVGASSTLISVPGALHEDPAFWSDDTLDKVAAFLASTLRGVPAAA